MLESGLKSTQQERRRSPRCKFQNGSLATNSNILGPILNLSMHGMAFEYCGEDLDDSEVMKIGIFIRQNKILLTGIQARLVRDQAIKDRSSFLSIIPKMRAIEFLEISDEQGHQLLKILKTQNVGTS